MLSFVKNPQLLATSFIECSKDFPKEWLLSYCVSGDQNVALYIFKIPFRGSIIFLNVIDQIVQFLSIQNVASWQSVIVIMLNR